MIILCLSLEDTLLLPEEKLRMVKSLNMALMKT